MPALAAPQLDWMAVLADATRVRLLRLLEQQELTVAELCAVVQQPQSTVSRHLKVLGEHGWVAARREATSRLYHMNGNVAGQAGQRLWDLLRDYTDGMPKAAEDDRRLAAVLTDRRTRSQAFFSSAAGQWDKLRGEFFGPRFDLLGLPALLDETWTIGDLGCGTAQLTEILAPYLKRIIAVDESAIMLRHARQRLKGVKNIELRRGDLAALPVDDGELDAAILCMVLHHLPQPQEVLREAARVLKPGGRLLIIDMLEHDRQEYRQQMGHVWLGFAPEKMAEWLGEAGFTRVRVQTLPSDPNAKGPATFTAVARRGDVK